MRKIFSIWRFVISLAFAKSLTWGKGEDTYLFHVGTFTDGKQSALKIVILPVSIMIGYARKE